MKLVMTCSAVPEQYDLLGIDGTRLGYFRLRHGRYTVEAPDVYGEVVYSRTWPDPADRYKGSFDDDFERQRELRRGVAHVLAWIEGLDAPGISEWEDAERVVGAELHRQHARR